MSTTALQQEQLPVLVLLRSAVVEGSCPPTFSITTNTKNNNMKFCSGSPTRNTTTPPPSLPTTSGPPKTHSKSKYLFEQARNGQRLQALVCSNGFIRHDVDSPVSAHGQSSSDGVPRRFRPHRDCHDFARCLRLLLKRNIV